MAVFYKLMKTGGNIPKNTALRFVRVEHQTIGLRRLSKDIEQATSLTSADILATITSLKEEMARQMMMSNKVHLPGIGYFSIALKGEVYEDPRTHRYRLRNAAVRTVKFRPDREFLNEMRGLELENWTYKVGRTSVPTAGEIDAALDELFVRNPVFSVSDFRGFLHLSSATAYRILSRLEKEERIVNIGSPRCKIFKKA